MTLMRNEICIIGLGNIGFPVLVHCSKYFPTTGYDIRKQAVQNALNRGLQASSRFPVADIYVVCVNTYYNDNFADVTAVDACCRKISHLNPNALVCFESTLQVKTARKMAKAHGLKSVCVCPHRWWEENQEKYGVKQLRVLGALNERSMKRATAFYSALEIPLHLVSSLEVAEATKIAENAHRYVQIAFVEELKLIAGHIGVDFEEWREAANTKWNVNLLEARDGIGKECLAKDTFFLASLYPDAELLKGAIKTNDKYVRYFGKNEDQITVNEGPTNSILAQMVKVKDTSRNKVP